MCVRVCVCVCVFNGQSDLVTALIYTIQAENESFDELPSGDDYSDQHRKNDTSDDDNMTEDGEYGAEDEPITSDGSFDDNMTEDGEYGTEDEPIASDEPFDESDDICSNSKTVVTFPLELCDRSISGNDLKIPLYDGSQTTLLQAVIKNLCWFCEHPSISKEALSESSSTARHSSSRKLLACVI